MTDRVIAYIDGFNYYHRIDDYWKTTGKSYKPLNYKSLIESLIEPIKQTVTEIYFFTAIDQRRPQDVIIRHKSYINSLESVGIKIILGQFHYNDITCRSCGNIYTKPSEKRTDVNIAVKMLRDGLTGAYDTCWLFSGDTDLIPAIEHLKEATPEKRMIVFPPPDHKFKKDYNYSIHKAFSQTGCILYKMRFSKFEKHLFQSQPVGT